MRRPRAGLPSGTRPRRPGPHAPRSIASIPRSRPRPARPLAPLASGCGDQADAPAFVGAVTGSDAVVGVVSEAGQATLYVCGGPTSYAHLTRWFTGVTSADGALQLQSAGGWAVTGNRADGSGTITGPGGETHAWTAHPASNDVAGLYAATDGACRTGAVVGDLDGKGATTLQGTWCDGSGAFAQVTPIIPMADVSVGIALSGIPIAVELPGPAKDLVVQRVRQP